MKPKSTNTWCDICEKHLSTPFALGRHFNEVHGRSAKRYKCALCPHKSKRPSDLTKHEQSKHPDIAKPKGCRRNRGVHALKSRQGRKRMAQAIQAAFRKPKSRRIIYSSDEEDITTHNIAPEPHTSYSESQANDDCKVSVLPLTDQAEVITFLPAPESGVATTIQDIADVGTVINLLPYEDIRPVQNDSPIYLSSGDSTPVRDELYYPITSPISSAPSPTAPVDEPISPAPVDEPNSPAQILPYPDYSSYAINSPIRMEALSCLLKGSRTLTTLEEDLAISDDGTDEDTADEDTADKDTNSNIQNELDSTYEYILDSDSDTQEDTTVDIPSFPHCDNEYYEPCDSPQYPRSGSRFIITTTETHTVNTTFTTVRETTCTFY